MCRIRLYNSDQRCPWCGPAVHSVCLWSLSEALEVRPAGKVNKSRHLSVASSCFCCTFTHLKVLWLEALAELQL